MLRRVDWCLSVRDVIGEEAGISLGLGGETLWAMVSSSTEALGLVFPDQLDCNTLKRDLLSFVGALRLWERMSFVQWTYTFLVGRGL